MFITIEDTINGYKWAYFMTIYGGFLKWVRAEWFMMENPHLQMDDGTRGTPMTQEMPSHCHVC